MAHQLVLSKQFEKAYKKFAGKNQLLRANISKALERLANNPNDPSLRTHKLSGKLAAYLACYCGYDCRIIFIIEKDITNRPYTVERLALVAGRNTDISRFQLQDKDNMKNWMKSQLWYSTAADMGVLNLFWENNFGERPGFVPNYIVPNKFSIIRCLSKGNGLAILPDFLCREAMDDHKILKIWEGYKPIENTLYFCKRKQSLFMNEIDLIEKMLVDELR